ncbi:MAG: cytochrome b/b6 domain-containing protein [Nitrosomonadales bacterium]|nr:cytochrome b/b6 domain-containing protein [Nitrosomonadales bacterium]
MNQTKSSRVEPHETATVQVWDRFLRFFHWTLALCFATAYISGEVHASTLHEWVGYLLCILLAARVYWGFRGGEFARFRSFLFPPGETLAYGRAMLKGNPKHYFGHNPAGALMVFAMFGLLAAIFASGLLTLGTIDFEGPLVFLANRVSDEASYLFGDLHEFLTHAALVLVLLHLVGVLVGSLQHRENLVRAMLTGKKKIPSQFDSNHKNK